MYEFEKAKQKEALLWGSDDWLIGRSEEDCPYPANHAGAAFWMEGFQARKKHATLLERLWRMVMRPLQIIHKWGEDV